MHVFIDTNILLNFFHFTGDDLEQLGAIFASHRDNSVQLHLTEQVRDEFRRNRERKIKDALRRCSDSSLRLEVPAFLRAYDAFAESMKLASEARKKRDDLVKSADRDIANGTLTADHLVSDMLSDANVIATSEAAYRSALRRVRVGNPPGKEGSLGDAINWELLLDQVPSGDDLHVISEDRDFTSPLHDDRAHEFLRDEWMRRKSSELFIYGKLSLFTDKFFGGVELAFDREKQQIIQSLKTSGSFAETHRIVEQLEKFSYFSADEATTILDAAANNPQVGWIVGDPDVRQLIERSVLQRPELAGHKGFEEIKSELIDED